MYTKEELEDKINDLCAGDYYGDEEEIDRLTKILKEIDPYNNMFHYGCKSWPNCETEGCCKC